MKIIFNFSKRYFRKKDFSYYSILAVFSILLSAVSLYKTYFFKNITNVLIEKKNFSALIQYSVILIFLTLFTMILNYKNNLLSIKYLNKIIYQLNKTVLHHIHKLPFMDLHNKDLSSLTQKINNDSNQIVTFYMNFFTKSIPHIFTIAVALSYILYRNYKIFFLIILSIVFYIFSYFKLKDNLFQKGYFLKEHQAFFFGKLYDQLNYFPFIKRFEFSKKSLEKLDHSFDLLYCKLIDYYKSSFIFDSLDDIISIVSKLSIFLYASIQIFNDNMSIGDFVVINFYYSSVISLTSYFFNQGKVIQDTNVSCKRLSQILQSPIAQNGKIIIDSIRTIKFVRETLEYNGTIIFKDIEATFEKGRIYGLIGKNGSGKTSLANKLMGLIASNSLYINNIDSIFIDFEELRLNKMTFCESEPVLFNETLGYNISLQETWDYNDIRNFISDSNLANFLDGFQRGLNSLLNPDSSNISCGEKQKIAILRTLYKDSEVLIFDEPTSSLDEISKDHLMNYLINIKSNKIIIIITHDISLLTTVDEVLNLNSNE